VTRTFWRKVIRKPGFVFGVIVLVPMIFAAIFAQQLAPYAPNDMLNQRYVPPLSPGHLLGTDNLGRDIFSRLLHGARLSLVVGFLAIAIALGIGTLLGVVAGYLKGAVDNVIMRVMDVLLAFPDVLLALIVITMLGPGLLNVMIALGVAGIPGYTRLARSATLEVAAFDYVEASRSLGNSKPGILFRHVLPNMIQPVLVVATLGIAGAILAAAALSFIGLGAPPGTAEWGSMLSDARTYMRRAWWMAALPGITITLAVLAISLMGEALRDVLDPRLK